jgi:hypothetical protein
MRGGQNEGDGSSPTASKEEEDVPIVSSGTTLFESEVTMSTAL